MIELFTKHPREDANKTYLQHLVFTLKISCRLFVSSMVFIIHGLFPFISMPKKLNLEETIDFLNNKNEEIPKNEN
jgi:hypothetical protein